MKNKIQLFSKNFHLIISLIIVIPTAIIYGFSHSLLLPQYLDIPEITKDLANFMRAIMCLYFGISFIWFLGILKNKYWKTATQLNFVFMLTLAVGRLLSMVLDGIPSLGFVFGVLAELMLAGFSFSQLRKYNV